MTLHLVVLAPSRLPGTDADTITRLLQRGDRVVGEAPDDRVLYGDLFPRAPDTWPAAALTRQLDAGDAADHRWLRADPAHFRVDPGSVRLMAGGNLGQSRDEVEALLATLAPLFGDEGFELSAPDPARWYLRPFASNAAPDFPALPLLEAALGGDLFELWPEDDVHHRWRRIFSEAQILLAQHEVNRVRSTAGLPAINGLWFWGAGMLPSRVAAKVSMVDSAEPLLRAFAKAADIALDTFDPAAAADGATLLDLRRPGDLSAAIAPLLEAWHSGRIATMEWRTTGARWRLRRWHRLRFWRR